jgi:hypothetical protein
MVVRLVCGSLNVLISALACKRIRMPGQNLIRISLGFVILPFKQNVTPKQNAPANGIKGSASLQVLVDFDQDTTVPNLRLEAKLSAEVSVLGLALFEFA